jgi:mRNA interferase RelE/StbE
MKYRRLRTFTEDFAKLPEAIRVQTRESFRFFQQNPQHPSLRHKKMKGHEEIWEGHITRGYVFTMQWDTDAETGEQIAVFRRIGKHDEIYAAP